MTLLAGLLFFLLPFERIPSVDVAGITVRLSSLVVLAFVVWGIPKLIRDRKLWPMSMIDKAALLYFLVALVSLTMATDLRRGVTVIALIGFVLCGYLLVSRAWRGKFDFKRVEAILIGVAFATSLFGLYQFFGDALGLSQAWTGLTDLYTHGTFGFARIQSVGLEPLYFANFLLLPIVMLAVRIATTKGSPARRDLGVLTIILWVFVLTLSRGAYIAIIACALVLLLLAWRYRELVRNIGAVVGVAIVALALAYGSVRLVSGEQGTQDFSSHAVNSPETRNASTNPRLERFNEAIRLFKSQPVLGHGIGQFGIVSNFGKPKSGYEIVNNQYLETLAETGLIGLAALIALAIALVSKLARGIKNEATRIPAIVLLVALTGIAVQYSFLSTIYILHVWALIGLIDALPSRE